MSLFVLLNIDRLAQEGMRFDQVFLTVIFFLSDNGKPFTRAKDTLYDARYQKKIMQHYTTATANE